jgi:hypothetical protein
VRSLVPERATERTFAILLLVFLLVFLLIDLSFYVKEPVDGGAFVAALAETLVS